MGWVLVRLTWDATPSTGWLTRDINDGMHRYHGSAGRRSIGSDKKVAFNPDWQTLMIVGVNVTALLSVLNC